jgi:hypothetical protein
LRFNYFAGAVGGFFVHSGRRRDPIGATIGFAEALGGVAERGCCELALVARSSFVVATRARLVGLGELQLELGPELVLALS